MYNSQRTPDFYGSRRPTIDEYMAKREYFKDLRPLRTTPDGTVQGEWTTGIDQEDRTPTYERTVQTTVANISMRTDVGGPRSKYELNEDSLALIANKDRTVIAIVDGAGGSGNNKLLFRAGRLASRVVDGALIKAVREHKADLGEAVHQEVVAQYHEYEGYATGVIVDITSRDRKLFVRLQYGGDSRALTLRKKKVYDQGTTRFQNMAQKAVDQKIIAPHEYYDHPRLNVITGGFGLPSRYNQPIGSMEFEGRSGDLIVVASDGFWDNVSDYEVEQLSAAHDSAESFQKALFALAFARNNDSRSFRIQHDSKTVVTKDLPNGDNITVAVLELRSQDPTALPEKINPNTVLRLPDAVEKQQLFKTMLAEVNDKIKNLKRSASSLISYDLKCRRVVLNVLFEQVKKQTMVSQDTAFVRMQSSLSDAEKLLSEAERKKMFIDVWQKIATMCVS